MDSDGASPRACFQFSEDLAKRVDFAPFLALAGTDKPALTSEGRQLCVDGLKHGERYNINLRAGLPSTVKESLPKSAEFNVYVRDRKPFVRFTGRAYVLPRTGQRGIPLVSVNTPSVNVNVFRIGDRNLINTVVDSDFQKTLSSYQLSSLGDERGVSQTRGQLLHQKSLVHPARLGGGRRARKKVRRVARGGSGNKTANNLPSTLTSGSIDIWMERSRRW